MASKSTSGFKMFLILLFCLIAGAILVMGAIMILSPGVEILGLRYASYDSQKVVNKITYNNQEQPIDFSDFTKIVIETEQSSVYIKSGFSDSPSNITFSFNANGFTRTDVEKTDFSYSVDVSGSVLNIKVVEPEINFLQFTNNSYVNINIAKDVVDQIGFEIVTKTGNVVVGESTNTSTTAANIPVTDFSLKTQKGTATILDNVQLKNTVNIETEDGNINIKSNTNASNIFLKADSGKINTMNLTNSSGVVNIQGKKGSIVVGDIAGDVEFSMVDGYFTAGVISGDFITNNDIVNALITIKEVGGKFTAVNNVDTGNFKVTIDKNLGGVDIIGANRGIKLSDVHGAVNIKNKGGSVNITIAEDNAYDVNILTENGAVNALFNAVCGTNTITTKSGAINIECEDDALVHKPFYLSAKTDNKNATIKLLWLDKTYKNEAITNMAIPSESSPQNSNKLILQTQKANIKVNMI